MLRIEHDLVWERVRIARRNRRYVILVLVDYGKDF